MEHKTGRILAAHDITAEGIPQDIEKYKDKISILIILKSEYHNHLDSAISLIGNQAETKLFFSHCFITSSWF
ncbi:MAG: hypothetical protein ACMUJM_15415 [bacterium]